jgi:hypothetical protein
LAGGSPCWEEEGPAKEESLSEEGGGPEDWSEESIISEEGRDVEPPSLELPPCPLQAQRVISTANISNQAINLFKFLPPLKFY